MEKSGTNAKASTHELGEGTDTKKRKTVSRNLRRKQLGLYTRQKTA